MLKINKPPNYKSAGGRVEFGVRSVYALNLTTVYTPPGSARVPCEQIHTNMWYYLVSGFCHSNSTSLFKNAHLRLLIWTSLQILFCTSIFIIPVYLLCPISTGVSVFFFLIWEDSLCVVDINPLLICAWWIPFSFVI